MATSLRFYFYFNNACFVANFLLVDKENNADSAYLSIAERVKLFSAKVESPTFNNVLRSSKRAGSRFRTQPITFEEVRMAGQCSTQSMCSNLGAFISRD